MTHIAESTHWYDKNGNPAYEVPYADPKKGMRATTLRDARKLDLWPSVTTIQKMLAQPGLERWKQNQILLAALTLPSVEGETAKEFEARIWEDANEHGRQARERGTAIHAAVQSWYDSVFLRAAEYQEICKAAGVAIAERFGNPDWGCEESFYHPLGYGGKVDINAIGYVGDFKTKEFDKDNLPKAYSENGMQLAAYREGLKMPDAVCFNCFISTNNPGLVHIHIWDEAEISDEWNVFRNLLEIWQIRNRHRPG